MVLYDVNDVVASVKGDESMASNKSRWMSVDDMSAKLNVPARTCQRWLKNNYGGLFPSAKKERLSRTSKWKVLSSEVTDAQAQLNTDPSEL